MGDPGPLGRLVLERHALEVVKRTNRLVKEGVEARKAEEKLRQRSLESHLKLIASFNVAQQAYEVDKLLPRDINLLTQAVRDERLPLQHRAKILEVIILRGAHNKFSYEKLASNDIADLMLIGLPPEKIQERVQYQAAAWDLVLNATDGGKLFGQLSASRDQLPDGPSGRYPATEWMNTMLRDGGLLGNHEKRQGFEKWLLGLDPGARGQAMFHLRDAMEAREMGAVTKVTGFEVSGGPVGFGLQWESAKDTHWDRVGNDVLGPVSAQLQANPEQNKAFYDGYRLADRELPDPVRK